MCNRVRRAAWLLLVLFFSTAWVTPLAAKNKKGAANYEERPESPEFAEIVNKLIFSENRYNIKVLEFSPRLETYMQYFDPQNGVGDVVRNDQIFLGRLRFDTVAREVSFIPSGPDFNWFKRAPDLVRAHLHLNYFAMEPLSVDMRGLDRKRYMFEPVRWEYLGDVRCLVIDVHPREPAGVGAFEGRIWVEDRDFNIVRLNGTRVHPPGRSFYVHFDCWRENLQPGLWLPVYIYSQETELGKRLRYKAETRLWGYDLSPHQQQQEWTGIQVEGPTPVHDSSEHAADFSPVESRRQFNMDAERNVLDRLEKARLIAPPGPVDKILQTVVNNLEVTNHLENLPPIQCRVMLTSSLESFSLAYSIVVSRGLIDVLPDEPSLAMILSHELAHIALGHRVDTMFAFNDRLEVSDDNLLARLDLARDSKDEAAADAKGLEFLKNSPYRDKLGQAGLFLKAAEEVLPHAPHLFGAHLGNGLSEGHKLVRMTELMGGAPALKENSVDQIAALPLGSRVEVNAWNGSVTFTDRKAVALVDVSEKLPFQLTPIIPYLRLYQGQAKIEVSAKQ